MRLFEGTPFDRPPHCEKCGELEDACVCPPPVKELKPSNKQTARIAVEKRKQGKLVTVVRGLASADNDLPALLTRLKSTCGAGGTLKDETLEIQGDHVDQIASLLKDIGYKVR